MWYFGCKTVDKMSKIIKDNKIGKANILWNIAKERLVNQKNFVEYKIHYGFKTTINNFMNTHNFIIYFYLFK